MATFRAFRTSNCVHRPGDVLRSKGDHIHGFTEGSVSHTAELAVRKAHPDGEDEGARIRSQYLYCYDWPQDRCMNILNSSPHNYMYEAEIDSEDVVARRSVGRFSSVESAVRNNFRVEATAAHYWAELSSDDGPIEVMVEKATVVRLVFDREAYAREQQNKPRSDPDFLRD